MKNKILILLSAVLLVACAPKDYKISGNVQSDGLEGVSVYVKEYLDRNWVTLDSAKIENAQFSFKGVCDSSRVVYFIFNDANGETKRQAFVLENGKINAEIDSVNSVKFGGTAQNDLLTSYMDEKSLVYKEANAYYMANKDAQTPEAKEAFQNKLNEYMDQLKGSDYSFCEANINSVVGIYVFLSANSSFDLEQKESIIALMTEETKANENIQSIVANIEKQKLTAKGQKFTDITLPGLESDSLSLSSLVGNSDYVLVDFWASWCGPCIRSFPELTALYEKYKGDRLQIFGVSLDNDNDKWREAIEKYNLSWSHVSDLQGWQSAGAALYAVRAIPATVLIDKDGVIVGRNLNLEELEQLLSGKTE